MGTVFVYIHVWLVKWGTAVSREGPSVGYNHTHKVYVHSAVIAGGWPQPSRNLPGTCPAFLRDAYLVNKCSAETKMSGAWTRKSVWARVYTRMKMLRCVTPVCGCVRVTGAQVQLVPVRRVVLYRLQVRL